jgi:membrane protease YdiL (CAAX protease family)
MPAALVILMVLGIYRIEGLNLWAFLLPAVAMALSSGIFGELLFRGVLFRTLEEVCGSWIALVVSSAVFGFMHLINPAATMMGAVSISIEAGLLLAAALHGHPASVAWHRLPHRLELHAVGHLLRHRVGQRQRSGAHPG